MKFLVTSLLLLVSLAIIASAQEDNENPPSVDDEIYNEKYFGIEEDDDREDDIDDGTTPAAEEEDPTTTTTTQGPRRWGHHGHKGSWRRQRGRENQNSQAPQQHHRGRHHWSKFQNMTAEEKLTRVCGKLQSQQQARPSRQKRGGWFNKQRMSPETRQQLETIMQTRKTEMLSCCNMVSAEKVQCVEEMMVARYNRVCNNEEPLCLHAFVAQSFQPAAAGTTTQSPTISTCCALKGPERSQCFKEAKQRHWQEKMNKKPWSRSRGGRPPHGAHGRQEHNGRRGNNEGVGPTRLVAQPEVIFADE